MDSICVYLNIDKRNFDYDALEKGIEDRSLLYGEVVREIGDRLAELGRVRAEPSFRRDLDPAAGEKVVGLDHHAETVRVPRAEARGAEEAGDVGPRKRLDDLLLDQPLVGQRVEVVDAERVGLRLLDRADASGNEHGSEEYYR